MSTIPPRPSKLAECRSIDDDASFERRLAEAIAWCQPRAPHIEDMPAAALRDDQLRPRVLEVDRVAVVRGVLRQRGWRVEQELRSASPTERLAGGRLLVYFPDAELSDGAAEAETQGFFDVNNTPPWDTWVGLFRDDLLDRSEFEYLVAWMPAAAVPLAQRAVEVNAEGSLAWLDDTRTRLAVAMRESDRG